MATAKSNEASPPGQGPQDKDVPAQKPALAASPVATPAAKPAEPVASAPPAPAPVAAAPAASAGTDTGEKARAEAAALPAPAAAGPAPKPAVKEGGPAASPKVEAAPKPASPKQAASPKRTSASKAPASKAAKAAGAPGPAKPAEPAKPAATAPRPVRGRVASAARRASPASARPVARPASAVASPATKAAPEDRPSVARTARVVAHTVAEALDRGAKAARQVEAAIDERKTASGIEVLTRVGLDQAREGYATIRKSLEELQGGLAESAGIASKGVAEINGKVLDLVRAQTDAAFSLWRQLLGVNSLSQAVQLQTKGLREGYERTSSHLKDIAETTGRVAETSLAPMRRIIGAWGRDDGARPAR